MRWERVRVAAAVILTAAVPFALAFAVPLPERLREPSSRIVEFSDGSPAYVFLTPDEKWRIEAKEGEIDPAYLTALVRLEDKRFWQHGGVDPVAVIRAAGTDLLERRRVSGASTLTMQLVRVLEPRPRTLGSKAVEAFRAFQLELRLSKREILSSYLTFVPYGKNLEGVEAASLAYFGHSARHLSAGEIATLLAVPQNPTRRYPSPENADRLKEGRDGVAARLISEGALPLGKGAGRAPPKAVLAQIEAAPVPTAIQPFPRHAPHAAIWLAATHEGTRLRSTLDRGLQAFVERTLKARKPELAGKGIYNGSVVLVDHRTRNVVALVGSLDFDDEAHGGQIAGFAVRRSPGSALKPFLYAMAIDQGLAGPQWLVPDVPTSYGGYAPRNYDGGYSGLVRLDDALSRSLNLPFVGLLDQLGVEPFLGRLRAMGVDSLDPDARRYGLSAAVGGVEITPLEVAGLYATLAEDGRYAPLALLAGEGERPRQAFAPGAAWLTRQALTRRDRPDFPGRRELSQVAPTIHWKTGTSFGHHDAWAAGSGPAYTAVVWLGNFDRTPSVELVGAEAAGPIFFDLLEGVADRAHPLEGDPRPGDLTETEVCAYSGRLAGPGCPERVPALALSDHVPTERCPFHRAVDVDKETGEAITPLCRAGREWETKGYLVWPAGVRRWFSEHGRTLPPVPRFVAGCQPPETARAPAIVSPAKGAIALLLDGVPPEHQRVPLEAETSAADGRLSWFVDGEFLGTVKADEAIWWTPLPGKHEILVSDESGLSTRRAFQVATRP